MRTFQCFDCGHTSEVTEDSASQNLYQFCVCTCHQMRVVSDKKGIKSEVLTKRFRGSWDK